MKNGSFVFKQFLEAISKSDFDSVVLKHRGDHKVQEFNCWLLWVTRKHWGPRKNQANNFSSLKRKKLGLETPLRFALNALIFALKDSA